MKRKKKAQGETRTRFLPFPGPIPRDENPLRHRSPISTRFPSYPPSHDTLFPRLSRERACTLRACTSERSVAKEYRRAVETKSNRRRRRGRRSPLGVATVLLHLGFLFRLFFFFIILLDLLLFFLVCWSSFVADAASPTCAGMRVRASFYRILLPQAPRTVPVR